MSTILSLPELERPREKAKHYGISSLSNLELLALIINQGPKNSNAFNVSSDLLSLAKDISKIFELSYQEFVSIKGISDGIAFKFLAIQELFKRKNKSSKELVFITSKNLAIKYSELIGDDKYESFHLIGLRKNKIIFEKEIYKGTSLNFCFSSEEIVETLIKENIFDFVIIHNHPSGDPTPSHADMISTKSLFNLSKTYDLNFIDHLIVAKKEKYYSFKENEIFNDFETL